MEKKGFLWDKTYLWWVGSWRCHTSAEIEPTAKRIKLYPNQPKTTVN